MKSSEQHLQISNRAFAAEKVWVGVLGKGSALPSSSTALQKQKAVTIYMRSIQILSFGFELQNTLHQ